MPTSRQFQGPGPNRSSRESLTPRLLPHAPGEAHGAASVSSRPRGWLWKAAIYFVTLGMLTALLAGLSLPWVTTTTAVIMICLDASDASPMLEQVSYPLIVFFCGMFVSIAGLSATGLPQSLWHALEPHAGLNSFLGTVVFCAAITAFSNIISNVPTVLLLGPLIASASKADGVGEGRAWLLLAWISTISGNFSLLSSAANIVVSEQAKRAQRGFYTGQSAHHTLTFWNHLRFGTFSTILVMAAGVPLIHKW